MSGLETVLSVCAAILLSGFYGALFAGFDAVQWFLCACLLWACFYAWRGAWRRRGRR